MLQNTLYLSGWYFRASFLYALDMSACKTTPCQHQLLLFMFFDTTHIQAYVKCCKHIAELHHTGNLFVVLKTDLERLPKV